MNEVVTDLNKIVEDAFNFKVWRCPGFEDPGYKLSSPIQQWLRANGDWSWNANLIFTFEWLEANHPDELMAALQAAVPFTRSQTENCWTGNVYRRSAEYLAIVIPTKLGDIPWACWREPRDEHLGYVGGKRRERWS
jgi:hypothetical protein